MISKMNHYVEIINSSKVRSNANLIGSKIQFDLGEWRKCGFYPNNGVVGIVIGDAQSYEGLIHLVQFGDRIIVPVLSSGVRDISLDEFERRYPNNKIIGRATDEQTQNDFNVDEVIDSIGNLLSWN